MSNLCDRFLLYLEVLHVVRSPYLKAAMQEHGYPLHIDATSEYGKGGLFVCMDGFKKWVLCAGKIKSESEAHLKPFVKRTIELFGDPIATVRDLGMPGKKAVAHLGQRGIPDFVCHYHFLGVVGEKLFDKPYTLLRNILKQSHVRSDLRQLLKDLKFYSGKDTKKGRFGPGRVREDLLALMHWVIQGEGKKDAIYPFGLPHLEFFQRCRDSMQRADIWVPTPRSQVEKRALRHLGGLMRRLEKDKRFQDAVGRLEKGWQAFTRARNTLRLTDAELPRGDTRYQSVGLPVLEAQRLKEIEKQVNRYLDDLRKSVGNESLAKPTTPQAIILKYFLKYKTQLFGHPVIRDNDGAVIAVVERTNNVDEHFFGSESKSFADASGGLISVATSKINPLKLPLLQTYIIPTTYVFSAAPWTISTMPLPILTSRRSIKQPRLSEAIAIPHYKTASALSSNISKKLMMSTMKSHPIMPKSTFLHPLFDAVR